MSQDYGRATKIKADYRRKYTNLVDNRDLQRDNRTDLKMYYDLQTYIKNGEIGSSHGKICYSDEISKPNVGETKPLTTVEHTLKNENQGLAIGSTKNLDRLDRIADGTTAAECRCDCSSDSTRKPKSRIFEDYSRRFARVNGSAARDNRREPNSDCETERDTFTSCRDECFALVQVLDKAKNSVRGLLDEVSARDRSVKRYETICRSYSGMLDEQIRIAARKDVEIRELRHELIRTADELNRVVERQAVLERDREQKLKIVERDLNAKSNEYVSRVLADMELVMGKYETMCRMRSVDVAERKGTSADEDSKICESQTDFIGLADEMKRVTETNAERWSNALTKSSSNEPGSKTLSAEEEGSEEPYDETPETEDDECDCARRVRTLNDRLAHEERENERLTNDIESLMCTVRDQEERIRDREEACAALEKTCSARESEIVSLTEENKSLRNRVLEADERNEKQRERMSLLSADANASRNRLERAERELCALTESHRCIGERLCARDAEIERARKELEETREILRCTENDLRITLSKLNEETLRRDSIAESYNDNRSEMPTSVNSVEIQTEIASGGMLVTSVEKYKELIFKNKRIVPRRVLKIANDLSEEVKNLKSENDALKNSIENHTLKNQMSPKPSIHKGIQTETCQAETLPIVFFRENESHYPGLNRLDLQLFIRHFVFFYDKIMELKKKLVEENGIIVRRNELNERLSKQRTFREVNGHPEAISDFGLLKFDGNDLNTKYIELLNAVLEYGRQALSNLANLLEKGHLFEPEECLDDQIVN